MHLFSTVDSHGPALLRGPQAHHTPAAPGHSLWGMEAANFSASSSLVQCQHRLPGAQQKGHTSTVHYQKTHTPEDEPPVQNR